MRDLLTIIAALLMLPAAASANCEFLDDWDAWSACKDQERRTEDLEDRLKELEREREKRERDGFRIRIPSYDSYDPYE